MVLTLDNLLDQYNSVSPINLEINDFNSILESYFKLRSLRKVEVEYPNELFLFAFLLFVNNTYDPEHLLKPKERDWLQQVFFTKIVCMSRVPHYVEFVEQKYLKHNERLKDEINEAENKYFFQRNKPIDTTKFYFGRFLLNRFDATKDKRIIYFLLKIYKITGDMRIINEVVNNYYCKLDGIFDAWLEGTFDQLGFASLLMDKRKELNMVR